MDRNRSRACGSAAEYHRRHRNTVDELCNSSQGELRRHCGQGREQGAVTAGTINNTSRANNVKLLCEHDWSGRNNQSYPQSLAKGESGTFVHASRPSQVDEAAVVYTDELGSAWLVAWSVSDKPDGYNKVYVETGSIAKYKDINWRKIKILLDVAMDSAYAADYENDNEAFANITTVGNKAALVATFNTTKPSGDGDENKNETRVVTGGTITNNSSANGVKFLSKHDWSGDYKYTYPESLAKGESGFFVHVSQPGNVDEAAVVYTDELGCGWLVAWSVTNIPNGYNKVYMDTGSIDKFTNIDWSKIKILLDVSPAQAYSQDNKHPYNEVSGKITEVGNNATVVATFNTPERSGDDDGHVSENENGVVTRGTITNNSSANGIKFLSKHDWSREFESTYPESLAKGESGLFVHVSKPGNVDEAAVVYTDELGCGWLVAWSTTNTPNGYNKVYMDTGSIDKFTNIDWSKIKTLLDVSPAQAYSQDNKRPYNEVFGTITEVGNNATVAATFNTPERSGDDDGQVNENDKGVVTRGTITNNSSANGVKFLSKHAWSGESESNYPEYLAKGESGFFVHASKPGNVDEAAVVYTDELGSGWLVAWSATNIPNGYNKVYMDTGSIDRFTNINWSEIKTLLDVAPAQAYSQDNKRPYNEVSGKITEVGDNATIVATFNTPE